MTQPDPHAKAHPFALVDPSPWPAVGSAAAFTLALGGLFFMHRGSPWLLALGVLLLLVTLFGWFSSVMREGRATEHTLEVRQSLRIGMGLFITSEVMFFVAFFWAFFHNSLLLTPTIATWPPQGVRPLDPWGLPFINTLILLLSALGVNWAHYSVQQGVRGDQVRGLALAIGLGIVFLSFQAFEYGRAAFGFKEGIYPSIFYMATGFHGFHVFVGVCFLGVNLIRAIKGELTPTAHVGFEAAAWYWHFVDVVWLFLFVWVYWWGR